MLPLDTVGSADADKQTGATHKSPPSKDATQMQKSSKASVAVSTSKEKDLKPYWNVSCEAISSGLLLPIGIDSPDYAAKSYPSVSSKTLENSWFSTEKFVVPQKNSAVSATFFPVECIDSADTVTRSKRIRIYPTQEQKSVINRWFGGSRWFYNQSVEHFNSGDEQQSKYDLCKHLHTIAPEYTQDVPRHTKADAVYEAYTARSAAIQKYKKGEGNSKLRFRSRKQPVQSCYILSRSIKPHGFYVRKLGHMKYSESLPKDIRDSRLVCEAGRYYLCVVYHKKRKVLRDTSSRVIALDPGIRTFMTYFARDGFGWLGHMAINRIQRLCSYLDDLLSRAATAKRPTRRTLRRAANTLRIRIRNLISELHWKVANFLVRSYDVILLPTFETSQMTCKARRKLRKKSVRQMLTLSHFTFKQRLKSKAEEYGVRVIDVCEAYTSKTISWTGEIVKNLGGAKVVKDAAGNTMDRDLNGARGIFIKNITTL